MFINAEATVKPFSNFTFKVFQAISSTQNISYSPYSTLKALEMLNLGASGEPEKMLSQLLREENLSLPKTQQTEILVANSLWLDTQLKLKKDYSSKASKKLKAEVQNVPFTANSAQAAKIINSWAQEKTKGLIDELVRAEQISTLLTIIASSIYIKSTWNEDGEPLSTTVRDFKNLSQSKNDHKYLVRAKKYLPYYEDSAVQIIELPFAKSEIHLGIILPNSNLDFLKWKASLNSKEINQWLLKLKEKYLSVYLPTIKVSSEHDLKQPLMNSGLETLLQPGQQFKKISDTPLQIGDFKQKTLFNLDEKGIEAAAVTYAAMDTGAAQDDNKQPLVVHVDRPFLFYLATKNNEHILFLGQYVGSHN